MRRLWLKYAAKIDALSMRERAMVFAAALALTLYVVFALAVEPSQRRQRILQSQIEQQKAEVATLQKRQQLQGSRKTDPDSANRARAEELKRQFDALDETLREMQRNLVPADRMNPLLREMLSRDAGLQLVALRTLPVVPLVVRSVPARASGAAAKSPPTKPAAGAANVYKHGVEITLQGSYVNLHDYLARLEQSPWRMFWWRARLSVEEHPRLTLTITIYTLSLDKAWLQV